MSRRRWCAGPFRKVAWRISMSSARPSKPAARWNTPPTLPASMRMKHATCCRPCPPPSTVTPSNSWPALRSIASSELSLTAPSHPGRVLLPDGVAGSIVGAPPSVRLGRTGNSGAAGGSSHPGRVLLREWRMGRSLQDLEQFDVEDQGAVRRDAAGGAPAVGQIRGNVEAPFGTFLHQLQCFGPAGDNAAYRELGGLAALVGAVKYLTTDQGAFVVGTDGRAGSRSGSGTFTDDLILQTGRQSDHALAAAVALEELLTGLACGAGGFFGQRLHLGLQGLEGSLH